MLAIVGGFALGVVLHRLPRLRRALDPFLATYYAVPTFVFYPVFIVMFGLNRWPLVAIGFLFAVVAMAINTLDGLRPRAARVPAHGAGACGCRAAQTLAAVILPGRRAVLFTGREVRGGLFLHRRDRRRVHPVGLRHRPRIAFAYNYFDNPTMYGLMLLLFGTVGTINMILWTWEQNSMRRGGR